MTPKQSVALCAALVFISNGESNCQESDDTTLLQMQSLGVRRNQVSVASGLLQKTHAIVQKVNAGQDPDGCAQANGATQEAIDAALPAIREQYDHLVNQIQIAAIAVEVCASRDNDGLAMLSQQGTDLETSRTTHATCRQLEHDLEGGLESCDQFDQLRNSFGNQECFPLPGEDGWLLAVQNARAVLDNALNQGRPLQESCNNAREMLASKQNECSSAQRRFEEDFCAHRASCANLQICRAAAEENYQAVEAEVASALESLHSEFRVIKHVECLLGRATDALAQSTIIDDDVLTSCSEPASTQELTMVYPTFEALVTCESTVLTRSPCTESFFEAEYQGFARQEAIRTACIQCPAQSLPTVTPAEIEPALLTATITSSTPTGWRRHPSVIQYGQVGLIGHYWHALEVTFAFPSTMIVTGVQTDYSVNNYNAFTSMDGSTWNEVLHDVAGGQSFTSHSTARYARLRWEDTHGSDAIHAQFLGAPSHD